MNIQVVITGVGSMGAPGTIAIQQVIESFRTLGISVDVAALIDADKKLEPSLRFLVRGINPEPKIHFLNPNNPIPLDVLIPELKLGTIGNNLVIYDATPTRFHWQNCLAASHIPRTTYMGEKPLITTFEELEALRRFSGTQFLHCDLIETQSAACLQLLDFVHSGQLEIEQLCFWRLNSSGLQKVYDFHSRRGVEGGALMDKSVHDLAIAVALLGGENQLKPEITEATPYCFIPCQRFGQRLLLTGYNNASDVLLRGDGDSVEWIADGAGHYRVQWNQSRSWVSDHYFSWIGVRAFDRIAINEGDTPLERTMERYAISLPWLYRREHSEGFIEEDARIAEIRGRLQGRETTLIVNFLSRAGITPWIWDRESQTEIPITKPPHGANSLARVLKQAVFSSAGAPQRNHLASGTTVLCHQALLDARSRLLAKAVDFDKEWNFGFEIFENTIEFQM